jgi:hypothetical protein
LLCNSKSKGRVRAKLCPRSAGPRLSGKGKAKVNIKIKSAAASAASAAFIGIPFDLLPLQKQGKALSEDCRSQGRNNKIILK